MDRIRKTPGHPSRSRMPSMRPIGREQFSTWWISPRREIQREFTALVVEDDTLQREALADLLKDEGLEVIECSSAEAAELVVDSTGPELKALVTDVSLSGEMAASNWPNMPSASIRISTSSWSPVARRPTFRKMLRFC
jgi:hypothetical protein